MKVRVAIVVLILACVALGVTLFVRNNQATQERADLQNLITLHSNDLVRAHVSIKGLEEVNQSLESQLAGVRSESESLSAKLVSANAELSKVRSEAASAAEIAAAEMGKRETRINELSGQNDTMLNSMADLNTSLKGLEKQIAETEQRLAASEGDREFLLGELKRLQTEKAELERQFNDLALVREQVRRLKDELSLAQRLEWIRRGIYGSHAVKGGELLMSRGYEPAPKASYDLTVELRQDGTAKVEAPATNAPPPPQ
jgi:chromosome segregation ATPase